MLALVAVFAGGLLAAPASACVKRLRWNDDPPYSMRLPDGRVAGWSVDLAQAALQRMGCRLELLEMPFARALAELKAGRLDMLDGAFALPERQVYAHFSEPQFRSRNLVFIRAADLPRFQAQALADLHRAGWRFGAQVGVVYGPAYAALQQDEGFRAKLQLVPRRTSLWLMLARGRVDVVMADEMTAAYEIAAAGLHGTVVATPLVVSNEAASMAFSKATTDLAFVQRYDATLQAMARDGSLSAILQRYGVPGAAAPANPKP